MRKVMVLLCAGTFWGALFVCSDLIAKPKRQLGFTDGEVFASSMVKHGKKKIVGKKNAVKRKNNEKKNGNKKKGSGKNKKNNNRWKYEVAFLGNVGNTGEGGAFIEPIVDRSRFRTSSIKVQSQPVSRGVSRRGVMQALSVDSNPVYASGNGKRIVFTSNIFNKPFTKFDASANFLENPERRTTMFGMYNDSDVRSTAESSDETGRKFIKPARVVAGRNIDNEINKISSIVNDTESVWERSAVVSDDLKQQLRHSYRPDPKESAKFRQELEKYRNIFLGARQNLPKNGK
ncbi:MAG: hypothetical protein LBJ96_03905 [Holosporaceae bacterium]|jgi:hypothetical protein|nr:hypothetical protein [Holosporaceae bacterium]